MAQPTYYEILGVSPTATQDEIRKRFRQLARRYHPDVASSPGSADRFKEINEAHRVLADAESRATYDANLRLSEMKRQRPAPEAGPRPASGTAPGPRPAGPPPGRPAARAGTAPAPGVRPPAERLVEEARQALRRLRYRDAENLARQSSRYNRQSSTAYEVLGDVLRARGRADEAIAMYSYALQMDRANRGAQTKLDRLVGQPSGPTMAGSAARAVRRPPARSAAAGVRPPRLLLGLAGAAVVAALAFVVHLAEGPAAPGWFWPTWDRSLLLGLAVSGGLAGVALAGTGTVGLLRDQVSAGGAPYAGRVAALLGLALASFYAAVLACLLLGLLRRSVPASLGWVLAACLAITLTFAVAAGAGAPVVLLNGGNVVLAAALAGWLLGDALRTA